LGGFKSILGVDERAEVLSRYCLVTAACTIGQYCMRRLIRGKHTDYHSFSGQYVFTLREYPVRKVLYMTNVIFADLFTKKQGKALLTRPFNY
jgi:hypothetical protein